MLGQALLLEHPEFLEERLALPSRQEGGILVPSVPPMLRLRPLPLPPLSLVIFSAACLLPSLQKLCDAKIFLDANPVCGVVARRFLHEHDRRRQHQSRRQVRPGYNAGARRHSPLDGGAGESEGSMGDFNVRMMRNSVTCRGCARVLPFGDVRATVPADLRDPPPPRVRSQILARDGWV